MTNYNSPTPNSDDLVGGLMTAIVIVAAILIAALSDHELKVPYLFVGPAVMAIVWIFTRHKNVSGILIGSGFALALLITFLAI